MFVVFGEDFPPLSCQWFFLGRKERVDRGLGFWEEFGSVEGPLMSASKRQLWFLSVSFATVLLLATESRSGVWILEEDRVIYGLSV
ncbi:hypothetical protein NC651_014864 [Populus alba x Populus x berolinensis]|nr:hypothetical protein NC651_014864 [Populus alba x Populus x berolinensis]